MFPLLLLAVIAVLYQKAAPAVTESILLIILGLLLSLAIWALRKYVRRQETQRVGALWRVWSSRTEAFVRLALMFGAAFLAHIIYARPENLVSYALAVGANAFLLYGVTHFFDRLIWKMET
jgi:hypothetical protein